MRVAQPPDLPSNTGNPVGVADWGRLFLGYFLLATQKKVTDRTTDETTSHSAMSPKNSDQAAGYSQLTNPANDSHWL